MHHMVYNLISSFPIVSSFRIQQGCECYYLNGAEYPLAIAPAILSQYFFRAHP